MRTGTTCPPAALALLALLLAPPWIARAGEPAPAGATPDAATPREAAATPPAKSEIVCRNEAPTGTRITRRVCKSRAEMEASAEAARRAINRPKANTARGD